MHSVAVAVNPSLFVNAGYDPLRDLAPVAMAAVTPKLIYVHPDVKANTLAKLLALTRMGKLSVASSGNGTTTHWGAEWLFRALAKADITHVPFQPAVATNAVVSGQVLVASMSMPPADVLDRLNAEVNKALTAKPVTERFETLSLEAQHLDRPATRSCLAAEVAKWEKLLKDIGVKVD